MALPHDRNKYACKPASKYKEGRKNFISIEYRGLFAPKSWLIGLADIDLSFPSVTVRKKKTNTVRTEFYLFELTRLTTFTNEKTYPISLAFYTQTYDVQINVEPNEQRKKTNSDNINKY